VKNDDNKGRENSEIKKNDDSKGREDSEVQFCGSKVFSI